MVSSIFTIIGISFGRIGMLVLVVSIISAITFINIPNRSKGSVMLTMLPGISSFGSPSVVLVTFPRISSS